MTPTPAFERIASNLNVQPLLDKLEQMPELWEQIIIRQNFYESPHKDTETIFVRGPLRFTPEKYLMDIGSYDYEPMNALSDVLIPIMQPLLKDELKVQELGRVLIVKLHPGGHIDEHVDEGVYADYFSRFHIALKTNPRATLTVGGQTRNLDAGEAWWFNHKLKHSGDNLGDTDRIHIIFDAVTDRFPMVSVSTT